VRAILLGGAAASSRLLERSAGRQVPVLVTYGLTEACSQVTTTRYETRFAPLGKGSGEPLAGTEVRIAEGRIQVRGPTMMAGYWNEARLDEGAWFDTGDLGMLDERGRLHVHARRSDLVVTGGENVYPAEVEDVIERFPGIAGAAVFGVADDEWGEAVAALLVASGEPPSDSALIEYLNTRLAPHKRPRLVCYAKALPLNAAGKLERTALSQFITRLRRFGSGGSRPE
jgi:o-succinylbenzoate---CoA ligase